MNDSATPATNPTENVTDIAPEAATSDVLPESANAPEVTTPARARRRFTWPMRIFVGYFLFDMVVRSFITLTPYDGKWRTDLEMSRVPMRWPSKVQLQKVADGKDEKYATPSERRWATVRSALWFWWPFPREKTAGHLNSPADYGKFAIVWLGTRLGFVGILLGLDEDWPMFSPNVRRSHSAPRVKLIYDDGTREQLWLLSEPYDPTHFYRWFVKRPLQIDLRLAKDYDARLGVSRNLAERYATAESGAALETIEMYEVKYTLPSPSQDARKVLSKQAQKPTGDKPFWRYDVATGKGKTFDEKKEKEKAKKKAEEEAKRAGAANTAETASAANAEAVPEEGNPAEAVPEEGNPAEAVPEEGNPAEALPEGTPVEEAENADSPEQSP